MSFTLVTSGAIIQKAGANANSTATASGALIKQYADHAEGMIVAKTRRDWVGQYSGLSANIKNILSDVASSLAAVMIINYDMSGFTSREEAGTMLDVLDDNAEKGLEVLKDFKSNTIHNP